MTHSGQAPKRHQKINQIAEERLNNKIKNRLGEEIVVEKAGRVVSRTTSWFSSRRGVDDYGMKGRQLVMNSKGLSVCPRTTWSKDEK